MMNNIRMDKKILLKTNEKLKNVFFLELFGQ